MGLHLGWIPNEPGLRPREFDRSAPSAAGPDPLKVAALRAAHAARALWTRLLIIVGAFALVLFGLVAFFAHRDWAWGVGAGVAICCWLPVAEFALSRRRANARLRRETQEGAERHAVELAEYEGGKALWDAGEVERIAVAPRWLRVAAREDVERLDVFGGTAQGRQNLLTGVGQALLENRAVVVVDLSQDRVSEGLIAAAHQAGVSYQDYQLPRDLPATPLLAGLTGDQVASLIVEVLHADDTNATAAGRATDLMLLRKITRVLGGDVTMSRLHEALSELLGDAPDGSLGHPAPTGTPAAGSTDAPEQTPEQTPETDGSHLTGAEHAGLRGLFGARMRSEVAGNLVRLAAVVEPLAHLGADAGPRPPARLTCLSLPDGPRDVAADLTAALIVQWATRSVADDDGFRPAVILAGADEQSTRHLGRLTTVCERYQVPLVRTFSRLTEESARHLDTRHTAFMRLPTRPEALRAAEHIGLERRFVAGHFSHSQSVSRSRTRTTSESVTHSTGSTQGEAVTQTKGTTTGQSYSEAEVPRQDTNVNVHIDNRHMGRDESGAGGGRGGDQRGGDIRQGDTRQGESGQRATREGSSAGGREVKDGAGKGAGGKRPEEQAKASGGWLGGGGSGSGGGRAPAAKSQRGGGWLSGGGGSGSVTSSGTKPKKRETDVVKTRTWFTAQHESEAKTQSWTKTEESSHTRSNSQSRTDGTSVGNEVTYELVYDHKVEPETLMALPEDQMLAPHIVAAAGPDKTLPTATRTGQTGPAGTGTGKTLPDSRAPAESKIVALVIDPSIVGSDAVAAVHPDEIPAYEPPTPAVSPHVPDYERVPRPALGPS
jgi:hypothetical protein